MAISLNDHESRIKALENNSYIKSLKVLTFDTISKKFTIPETNWDFCLISAVTARYDERTPTLMLKRDEDSYFIYGLDYNNYMEFRYTSSLNELYFMSSTWNMSKIIMFALKLYYNFSYNIYRLDNSISFHFFKCLIKIRN